MADAAQGQACDRCHRRKTRCDKQRPVCGPCLRAQAGCVYSERAKQSMYRREFVEGLERRIQQLEAKNRRLAAAASVASVDSTPRAISQVEDAPSNNRQVPNDIANEVSFLSTSAGGDRQFLGSTSGILLASLVKAGLTVTPESQAQAAGLSLSSNASNIGSSWGPNDNELPPEQLSRSLIEAYLAHDHLSYPFLHPQAVQATVDSIYRDVTFSHTHPFELFMFNMILAIATSQVYKFNWQVLPDAETHHHRAMAHVNDVLSGGGLRALQAVLLLCQFRLSSSTKDSSGSLWHLVGIAARMCFELGLHRETMYRLNKTTALVVESCLSPKFEENEVRRRCFWSVFALDRVVSITLGRPLAIRPDDVDVDLPSEDLSDVGSPSALSPEGGQAASQIPQSYRTGLFLHLVRYRDICGRCLTSLHRGSRVASPSDADLHRLRSGLAQELEAWRADTDILNLGEIDLMTTLAEARSCFRSKAWYELLYHNGVLLLYRPTSSSSPIHGDGFGLQQLYSAAKQSTTLYAYLLRSRKINFSWITMHSVFMAGLSYIYALSRHFREKKRQNPVSGTDSPRIQLSEEPSIMDIVNTCRACSNVLVAVSERCNAQKNCHEVFDRLSDAVLADAVAAISQSTNSTAVINAAIPPDRTQIQDDAIVSQPPVSTFHNSNAGPEEFPSAESDLNFSLAVDTAFRDCFTDLQGIGDARWGDDAILQLSIDWLGEIDPGNDLEMGDWAVGT